MKKFEMLNIICQDCELTAKEKLVAQYFVYKSNKSGACYPCVDKIAEQCSVSRRTVQRATKKLAEKSYIIIEKRFKFGKQTSNLYSFNILLLEEIEREKEKIQEEDKAEDKAMEPTIKVVDLEELLAIQEQETIVDEETEEIDLDDLVAANDSVWEDAYDNPFENNELENRKERKIPRECGAEQQINLEMIETQAISQKLSKGTVCLPVTEVNMSVYNTVKYCEMGKELYSSFMLHDIEKEELLSEGYNEASNNVMGAFFPP